jgi:acetyl-CoA decarbonylase/synthase complex subunit delta
MPLELVKEKWTSRINTVTIGATKEDGGSRTSTVTVGGESTLPFLLGEGEMPHPPVVAMEVLDRYPEEWSDVLKKPFEGVLNDPAKWAAKCVNGYGAELICVRLQGTHPDWGNAPADKAAGVVKAILDAVGVPLIILGSGDDEKDNTVLARCSQATRGERCLIGEAVQENYKTLAVSCLADGHNMITQSPIDINIQKQVNILVSDMGVDITKIVIDPTTGALGYGMEYAYSIMERARIAGLLGDKMLAMPIISLAGEEVWKVKEAKAKQSEYPQWGDEFERGPLWEATTAGCMLQAGTDIVVMFHPKAVLSTKRLIESLMKKGQAA